MKKAIVSLIIFYFLALFQTSYLVLYQIKGASLNLILLLIISLNFFEKKEEKSGLWIGAIAGFYLDIFSSYFFGFYILLGLAIAFLVKLLKPFFEANKPISFAVVLLAALIFYYSILALTNWGCNFCFNIFELVYNLLAGLIIYFLVKPIYVLVQKRFNR